MKLSEAITRTIRKSWILTSLAGISVFVVLSLFIYAVRSERIISNLKEQLIFTISSPGLFYDGFEVEQRLRTLSSNSIVKKIIVYSNDGKILAAYPSNYSPFSDANNNLDRIDLVLNGVNVGNAIIEFDKFPIFLEVAINLILLIFVCVFFLLLSLILTDRQIKKISSVFSNILEQIRSGNINHSELTDRITESRLLIESFLDFKKLEEKMIHASTFNEIATQVAHDVRSPLAALDMVMKDSGGIPEEQKRVIVRSAVNRINDIANELLIKNRELKRGVAGEEITSNSSTPGKAVLLSSIIDDIVTEKRTALRSRMNITIEAVPKASSYGLFADIPVNEMKRVCSNLLNNSIEALKKDEGRVEVELLENNDQIEIKVKDNGKGISQEILNKLGQRGETHGKKDGSGLGLYHAKKSVESWGGNLNICSKIGQGTTVTIGLPKADPPLWFVPKLELRKDMTIVVLDDDTSIHQIWDERISPLGAKIIHYTTPDALINWYKEQNSDDNVMFLVDYELLNQNMSGLDLIEKLNLLNNTYLITSRYEENEIINRVKKLNIGMVPKSIAPYIPINFEDNDKSTVISNVLCDNDPLIREIWECSAKINGIKLKTFGRPDSLLSELSHFSVNTIFYIDSDLDDHVKGEDIAKILFEKGYKKIYITTGYEVEALQEIDYILGVIGKEPPWKKTVPV